MNGIRPELEFFFRPEKPVPFSDILFRILDQDFDQFASPADQQLIENFWITLKQQNPRATSTKDLVSLYSVDFKVTEEGTTILSYLVTDFKTYVGINRSSPAAKRPLGSNVYERCD